MNEERKSWKGARKPSLSKCPPARAASGGQQGAARGPRLAGLAWACGRHQPRIVTAACQEVLLVRVVDVLVMGTPA